MKYCANPACNRKFGLVRHYLYTGLISETLAFHTSSCKQSYLKQRQEAVRKRQFEEWLARPT